MSKLIWRICFGTNPKYLYVSDIIRGCISDDSFKSCNSTKKALTLDSRAFPLLYLFILIELQSIVIIPNVNTSGIDWNNQQEIRRGSSPPYQKNYPSIEFMLHLWSNHLKLNIIRSRKKCQRNIWVFSPLRSDIFSKENIIWH